MFGGGLVLQARVGRAGGGLGVRLKTLTSSNLSNERGLSLPVQTQTAQDSADLRLAEDPKRQV